MTWRNATLFTRSPVVELLWNFWIIWVRCRVPYSCWTILFTQKKIIKRPPLKVKKCLPNKTWVPLGPSTLGPNGSGEFQYSFDFPSKFCTKNQLKCELHILHAGVEPLRFWLAKYASHREFQYTFDFTSKFCTKNKLKVDLYRALKILLISQ